MAEREQSPGREQRAAPWHALTGDEARQRLDTTEQGLSSSEASERLASYGPNQLYEQKGRPAWKRLLDQFNNLLILILLVAGVVSALLGKPIDAGAIFGVVLITALIGFIQEGKAEQALESIKGMLSPKADVIRDGQRRQVAAEEVVPGDILVIESGSRIAADARLWRATRFRTQEAPLTGESQPVDKTSQAVGKDTDLAERASMAFAGTLAVEGEARGIVVSTGTATEIGRISRMLAEVETIQTPLLRQLDRSAKVLAAIIIAAAALTAVVGVLAHGQEWIEVFMAGVALAVAAIPQGLPAIVTITLALGVRAMAGRNAIIRRLPAVETLGSTMSVFTDKTGTLTRNEMTAQTLRLGDGEVSITGVGYAPRGAFYRAPGGDQAVSDGGSSRDSEIDPAGDEPLTRFLTAAALCNNADLSRDSGQWSITGDPTEAALAVAAAKAGEQQVDQQRRWHRLDAIPFDSERQYMATLDASPDGSRVIHIKGAPDELIDRCDRIAGRDGDQALDHELWHQHMAELSARGLRVLAVAEKRVEAREELAETDVEEGVVLLGLVGLLDPPREAAREAIQRCYSAGIRPIMVTGDSPLTARAVAAKLGMRRTEEALTGRQVAAMSDEELSRRSQEVDVYARAAPEHKLRLVRAAQARGEVCAMTGDGVNDAPALKRADVGVAMGIQGTEAAKETSEMVLADDNFASIVNAVEEGRTVYDNIKKTITFLLPANGGQAGSIMLSVMAGTMLPVTPVQALWVNMVVAVTLGLALAFEPAEGDIMHRPPRDPNAPLLDMFLLWRVLFVSVLLLAGVYGMFLWLLVAEGMAEEVARAGAVNMLVMGSAAYLVNSRFRTASSLSLRGILGGRPVLIAIGLIILLQVAWTYTAPMQFLFGSGALGWSHWATIAVAAVAIFLVIELEKAVRRRMVPDGSTPDHPGRDE